jgi:hypothetical protein
MSDLCTYEFISSIPLANRCTISSANCSDKFSFFNMLEIYYCYLDHNTLLGCLIVVSQK